MFVKNIENTHRSHRIVSKCTDFIFNVAINIAIILPTINNNNSIFNLKIIYRVSLHFLVLLSGEQSLKGFKTCHIERLADVAGVGKEAE